MRLTLRTLLAYMDDVLDPADHEELGRKIESSPFATELIHRSRDAVRRLRLSAPEVLADESGDLHGGDASLDANATAEYLDNTLSPEAVADYERHCLEAGPNADMLLAEAASCHHVLTMVLGEPAEVDADLRQRLYALIESPAAGQQLRTEPAHAAPTQPAPPAPPAAVSSTAANRAAPADSKKAGVPDYLLAAARQRRRSRRAVTAAVAAFLLGGGAVWLFWPQKPVEPPTEVAQLGNIDDITGGLDIGSLDAPPATDGTEDSPAADGGTTDAASVAEAPPFNAGDATAAQPAESKLDAPPLNLPSSPTAEEGATPADSVAMTESAQPTGETPPTLPPVAEDATDPESDIVLGPSDAAMEQADQADEAGATGSVPPPALVPPGPATNDLTPTPGEAPSLDSSVAAPVMTADASSALKPTNDSPTDGAEPPFPDNLTDKPEAAAAPKPIGAYLGNNDVLLRLDPRQNLWVRLPPRTPLMAGDALLSLPTFRTHVVLADANVYLNGGAELDILAPGAGAGDSAAEFGLRVPYGQLILNSGLNGNRVDLSLAGQDRLLQLGPSSSLAIEVRPIFTPGAEAHREPAPVEITWYLTSGTAQRDERRIEAPAMWVTVDGDDRAPAPIEDLPEWVDREPISDSERRARDAVAEALAPSEPVSVRLLELSDPADRGRRTEVRSLAARSGAYVGQYDALVSALGDLNQKASWRTQIETLRDAIARDPSAIDGIREAFSLERGQEAAGDLTEMLLGFDSNAVGTTRDEVQAGALVRLIRWMDDDDLTYRVLASYNFDEITGTRALGSYRPEQNAAQRKRSLRHHWDRLERGELAPKDASTKP